MDDTTQSPPDPGELIEAVPGRVAVQVGGEFAHVSEAFAETVGTEPDALRNEPWRSRFDSRAVTRLESAIAEARSQGHWDGRLDTAGGDGPDTGIDVTLSAMEGGAIVWTVEPADGDHGRSGDLERYETIVETVDDGVYVTDEDLRVVFANERFCELFGRSREDVLGTDGRELYERADELEDADSIRDRLLETEDSTGTIRATLPAPDGGERVLESRYRLDPDPVDGEFQGSIGIVRDVTDRIERERTLERRRDELETLDRINELHLEAVRELIRVGGREAVESTVCERLADSGLYKFAWVGGRELGGDRIVPRASAGEGDDYLEAVTIRGDRDGTMDGPVEAAMRTAEVRVANVDDDAFGPRQDAARERGFESIAAVPLQNDDVVYGVLAIYATREDGFDEREQAGFDALGRTIGLVIHASRSRDLLFADSVAELEFAVEAADSPLARTAVELDCELAVEGYVPSGDRWILYLDVAGVSPDAVVEAMGQKPGVDRTRTIRDGREKGRVELVLGESSLLDTVAGIGATVRTVVADPEAARLVVEAPGGSDVRGIVEGVHEAYPGSRLLAKQERDREATSVGHPGSVLDGLTDRQREALETAYRAGYYAWPRESTAEEIAASLDLTAPTLHGHLRKAERIVLSRVLGDE